MWTVTITAVVADDKGEREDGLDRMPTNVTAEYKAAEAAYKKSRDAAERLRLLKEMLRLIPKHKGTDHLQAEIKSKIKELTEDLTGPRKGAARHGPAVVIRPEGAAQVALLGPPNSGKSALHATLTGSRTASEAFPFATQYPQPGMMPFEDISIQIIDLPSISPEFPIPWIADAVQPADAAWLVVDIASPGCLDRVAATIETLEARRVHLVADWDPPIDPFAVYLPTLLVATKADLMDDPKAELETFQDLSGLRFESLTVSAVDNTASTPLGAWTCTGLRVIRVYTKIPGQPPDMSRPFTLRRGATVGDVAALVHKEVATKLRFARVWDKSFEGRKVGKDHPVGDGDVIELHD